MADYKDAAEFLRVVAHPARLVILERLKRGVMCVSDMEGILGVSQPNVSQHLGVLRRSGVVDFYMDGRQRCYFLKDARALDVLAVTGGKKKDLAPPSCCPSKPVKGAGQKGGRGQRGQRGASARKAGG